MLQKIFVNYFVATHKSKVTLTLNKPRYITFEYAFRLMHEFHYDYIENIYGNKSRP